MALPTMAPGFSGELLRSWCQLVDDGPFSSISTGERITFVNPEMLTTLAASAALTERVAVMANLVVAPLHRAALLAKQLATIDELCAGRLVVGLGVGGRPHDYRSVGAPFEARHAQVDAMAAELRRLWSGEPPFEGADPVGPPPVRPGGPPLMAGAMGPKGVARAARWADGITGFSLSASSDEITSAADGARRAWEEAGRSEAPWLGTGTFCVLGTAAPREDLRSFARRYLGFLGDEIASAVAEGLRVADPATLAEVLDAAAGAGIDEFTVVPGSWELRCAEAIAEAVEAWRG